jgi:putative N-acetylmannosamine-6-phosphate epimerase
MKHEIDDTHVTDRSGHFNRRDLLGGSALLGAALLPERSLAQQTGQPGTTGTSETALTIKSVYAKARERLYPVCRICPECDGVACAGEMPGMGGVGSGMSFQNNFVALRRVRLNLRTLTDVSTGDRRPDTSTTIFGQKLSFPALAAPIGRAAAAYGKGMAADSYFDAVIGGCVDAGTTGGVGDTPAAPIEDIRMRCNIVARYNGKSIYGIKPVPNKTILSRLPMIEASRAFMMTIDIDAAGSSGGIATPNAFEPKTVAELRELVRAVKVPLVIKGIMTPDEALKAAEAGAAGIVVSNHGGRVLDYTPGTAEVLPAIADKVKGKMVIFVDGSVRYGNDVIKYMALGADAVLVGRHLVRAAHGGGRAGVALFMRTMRDEMEVAMVRTGVSTVSQIGRTLRS